LPPDRPGPEPRWPHSRPAGVSPGPAPEAQPPAAPDPDSVPPEPAEAAEPTAHDVLARFTTAARALMFAEQVMRTARRDSADCSRGADGSWWVAARLPLAVAREMAGLSVGRLYASVAGSFVADRGWGDDPGDSPPATLPSRLPVPLLDLVQVAGLHQVSPAPLPEVYVLIPGYLIRGVLERAQDLRLRASYQLVRLDPLFTEVGPSRSCYAVRLAAAVGSEALPAALLSALADDPFTLVCRPAGQALLVGYGSASPLSDQALARLVAAGGGGTWLLAGRPDGCARVTWAGEPLDPAGLVELGPAHALIDLDGNQPYLEASAAAPPAPRPVTLAPSTVRTTHVDAMLLSDADLESLPLLLAGDPLADSAFLVRGAARHLMTAPGGLLSEIAVGEPLTCIGPGSIYVPTWFRLDPPLGPAARAALFPPDKQIAQVVLRDARLGYDLDTAEPVWALWAGPVPEVDAKLPRQALADLDQVAREIGEPPRPRSLLDRVLSRAADLDLDPAAWRRQALEAEHEGDYATAAQLYARHNEPLRAARMWEREAEEKY
jgi:hypothetical protein